MPPIAIASACLGGWSLVRGGDDERVRRSVFENSQEFSLTSRIDSLRCGLGKLINGMLVDHEAQGGGVIPGAKASGCLPAYSIYSPVTRFACLRHKTHLDPIQRVDSALSRCLDSNKLNMRTDLRR
ncbi:hypothetical protein BDV41DRAFT_300037 [Aspergillus transmontanensis]|uniref:Uncharacterized protein n=1 Tax=Aspergillus transmontanensis TaxID=1034304 RepID=A0A5N6VW74_9EURO|nr:hypothetical protein BDV41DRAFT_300037 [Aspergillus transmontanensis]